MKSVGQEREESKKIEKMRDNDSSLSPMSANASEKRGLEKNESLSSRVRNMFEKVRKLVPHGSSSVNDGELPQCLLCAAESIEQRKRENDGSRDFVAIDMNSTELVYEALSKSYRECLMIEKTRPATYLPVWAEIWGIDDKSILYKFAVRCAEPVAKSQNQASRWQYIRVLLVSSLAYFDSITDITLGVKLLEIDRTAGIVIMSFPFFVGVGLALFAWFNKESFGRIVASLFQLKPILDGIRFQTEDLRTNKHNKSTVLDAAQTLMVSKIVQTVFEGIPETFFQIYYFISNGALDIAKFQGASITSSLLTLGFAISYLDYSFDTAATYRSLEPHVVGYIPSGGKKVLWLFFNSCFIGAFCGLRIVALCTLFRASTGVFTSWVVGEFLLFTAAKLANGTYHYFNHSPFAISHIFHILGFFLVGFAPSLTLRNPYLTISGAMWMTCVIWGYLSSFAMLLVVDKAIPGTNVSIYGVYDEKYNRNVNSPLIISGILFGISLFSLLFEAFFLMHRKYASLFWRNLTPRRHFREHIWSQNTFHDLGDDLDDHRGSAINGMRPAIWHEGVKVWLSERRHIILKKKWCDDEWKKKLPREYLDVLMENTVERDKIKSFELYNPLPRSQSPRKKSKRSKKKSDDKQRFIKKGVPKSESIY